MNIRSTAVMVSLLFSIVGCGETSRDYMPDSIAGMSLLLPPDEDYSAWIDRGPHYMNDLGTTKCRDVDWYSADACRMADYVNRSNQMFAGKVPTFTREKSH